MTSKRFLALVLVLALLPAVAVVLLYGRLPDRIPTHWGIDGAVTYGGKSTLLMLAVMSPLIAALFLVLPKIDPRRKNYKEFRGYYNMSIVVVLLFLLAVDGIVLSESFLPGRIPVGRAVNVCVGLVFIFVGSIMPKVKNNFFIGLRTPWTLSDPDVWDKTNRLGGKLFFWLGIAIIPCGLLLPERITFVLLMAGVLAASLVPAVLSYVWFRRKNTDAEGL